jgi:hypothetical protein
LNIFFQAKTDRLPEILDAKNEKEFSGIQISLTNMRKGMAEMYEQLGSEFRAKLEVRVLK